MQEARSILGQKSPRNVLAKGTVFAVMKAYLDGTSNGRMMTLACVAADDDSWAEVEHSWLDVVAKRGRGIKSMHMAYAMSLQEQFKGWDPEDRNFLVDGLLNVLLQTRTNKHIQAFSCTVDLGAHRYWSQRRTLPPAPRICARIVVPVLLEWDGGFPKRIVEVKAVEVTFDRNESFIRHVYQDWANPKARKLFPPLELIASMGSATMELTPALQVADMIAWGRNRVECARLLSASPWEDDDHYVTAARAANAVNGTIYGVPNRALKLDSFRDGGFVTMYPAGKKRNFLFNMKKTSNEYKKFDRMMQALVKVPRSDIKAKIDAEKEEKRKKAKQSSASGRASSERD